MDNQSKHEHKPEHSIQETGKSWYDKSYKLLLIIPAIFLIFSLVYLVNFNNHNGDVIYKDVSLTGGTTVTVFDVNADVDKLSLDLKKDFADLQTRRLSDVRTGKQAGFIFETKADADTTTAALEKYLGYALDDKNSSIEFSGASLSSGFYQQLRMALLIAFVLMAIVVFIIFRTPVPSGAVVLSAFADIVMTVVVVDMIGINLSSAGIIAFLMLIGYSVDTDILLTTRVIKKHEGKVNERIFGAFKTGITMTLTSVTAVAISLLIIYNFSETLRQIFTILLIGLGFDIFNTWVTNASILKWYAEVHKIQ
jgi:preprotein translocase subunit SecF